MPASQPGFSHHGPARTSGILLHPTSLPSRYGIGDLGPEARSFVDALAHAGQTWWQMLPLTPPGAGDSPYQSYSAFAGNPLLISPDDLHVDGLLTSTDLVPVRSGDSVGFPLVHTEKQRMLDAAWARFKTAPFASMRRAWKRFRKQEKEWLEDYALFTAIQASLAGELWQQWPEPLRKRNAKALATARRELADAVDRECFVQFLFHRQITALKQYANARGVRFIGDLPIFVSGESADVWTRPELFKLDRAGRPKVIAGVPPDIFSKTGQLWGNPLYNWGAMRRDRYAWWIARLRSVLTQCDLVRLDHFRGFAAAWEVPAGSADARAGKWVRGPGAELFEALKRGLGGMPLIAEDLGVITPDVIALRDRFSLPGMRVLQFGFVGNAENPHLPQNFTPNNVAYTGTHDNDTTEGWFKGLPRRSKSRLLQYVTCVEGSPPRALTRIAWESVASIAIAPLQDLLGLDSKARMNTPGTAKGNWKWRLRQGALRKEALLWLKELTMLTGRSSIKRADAKGRRKSKARR